MSNGSISLNYLYVFDGSTRGDCDPHFDETFDVLLLRLFRLTRLDSRDKLPPGLLTRLRARVCTAKVSRVSKRIRTAVRLHFIAGVEGIIPRSQRRRGIRCVLELL